MPVRRNTANEDKNITEFPAPRLIIFIQERRDWSRLAGNENQSWLKTKSRYDLSRSAICVRVSTDKQTIENQLRELRQIAERRVWQYEQNSIWLEEVLASAALTIIRECNRVTAGKLFR